MSRIFKILLSIGAMFIKDTLSCYRSDIQLNTSVIAMAENDTDGK